jgi:glycosyltransferase involved in cell wall biosynthesis
MPLISIVTPSFNQARFLRRTIDSVLSQDYPQVEYVVIDGGSTDGSVDVLRTYGDTYGDRIRWVSEPDRGQSDAINKGFAHCRGAIRAYLNSDDVLWPGALRAVVAHFDRHPDWELVYGNAYNIDADDRILGRYPTAPYSFERLLHNCIICQPAAFWRARIVERVGPFDAGLHYAMDLDYWLRIDRARGRIVHVPEVLACSRIHPATKTLSARGRVYCEILETCRRHAGAAGFSQYFAYWYHRCHGAKRGWPRWLRWLPRPELWLAILHARWHRHHGRVLPLAGDLLKALCRRMAGGPSVVPIAASRNGWLAPECTFDRPADATLQLVGSVPKDLEVTVSTEATVLAAQTLRAHREERIVVALPEACQVVQLRFSGHVVDAAGRAVSFRLREANCKID